MQLESSSCPVRRLTDDHPYTRVFRRYFVGSETRGFRWPELADAHGDFDTAGETNDVVVPSCRPRNGKNDVSSKQKVFRAGSDSPVFVCVLFRGRFSIIIVCSGTTTPSAAENAFRPPRADTKDRRPGYDVGVPDERSFRGVRPERSVYRRRQSTPEKTVPNDNDINT